MADRAALEAAAAAGVISADQVGSLDAFLNAQAPKPVVAGEEDLRFIRNFHDVFLAIGIVLLSVGMGVGISTIVVSAKDAGAGVVLTGELAAGAAVVLWLLGEFFARRRRLFLPAIAIVCCLTVFTALAAASLYSGALFGRTVTWTLDSGMPVEMRMAILIAAACVAITPALFYARFRLPFSLGLAGAGAALFVIAACMIANWTLTTQILPAIYLVLGIMLFFAALGFDARDPQRQTRLSDNGFWLHFAAAPLILNGVFGLIGMALSGGSSPTIGMMAGGNAAVAQAGATLAAIVLLGFVSLLINRRALIVSALLTAGIAIGALLNATGLGSGALAGATLITLGGFVLILGAAWHGARRVLLGWVKPEGPWARIFPPEGTPL
ncbi:MAG: hypothetical protein WAU68_04370 [Vitreimonas sp.]